MSEQYKLVRGRCGAGSGLVHRPRWKENIQSYADQRVEEAFPNKTQKIDVLATNANIYSLAGNKPYKITTAGIY